MRNAEIGATCKLVRGMNMWVAVPKNMLLVLDSHSFYKK